MTLPETVIKRKTSRPLKLKPKSWRDGRHWACDYKFYDPAGVLRFIKKRYKLDPEIWRDKKDFLIYGRPVLDSPNNFGKGKPDHPDYESWLYVGGSLRIQDIGGFAGKTVHFPEGEDCADLLDSLGLFAVSIHQGAGNATSGQMRQLLPAARVIIWMDKDDQGAYDAASKHDLLVKARFKGEISILRAYGKSNKDIADQIRSGFGIHMAKRVNRTRLAKTAAIEAARRASGGRGKYGY